MKNSEQIQRLNGILIEFQFKRTDRQLKTQIQHYKRNISLNICIV